MNNPNIRDEHSYCRIRTSAICLTNETIQCCIFDSVYPFSCIRVQCSMEIHVLCAKLNECVWSLQTCCFASVFVSMAIYTKSYRCIAFFSFFFHRLSFSSSSCLALSFPHFFIRFVRSDGRTVGFEYRLLSSHMYNIQYEQMQGIQFRLSGFTELVLLRAFYCCSMDDTHRIIFTINNASHSKWYGWKKCSIVCASIVWVARLLLLYRLQIHWNNVIYTANEE